MAAYIVQLAKLANVSTATVSRVLNGKSNVSEETRNKVLALAEELNYTPNHPARIFSQAPTKRILVTANTLSNRFFATVLEGIQNLASLNGYDVFLSPLQNPHTNELRGLLPFKQHCVDGLIVVSSSPSYFRALDEFPPDAPIVQCSEYDASLPFPYVAVDNYISAKKAVQYLISLGHKKIGLFNRTATLLHAQERERGFYATMEECGLPINPRWIVHVNSAVFETAYSAARNLLMNDERPTAVFATSDSYAAAVIHAANALGLRVPEDLSVIGFDNIVISTLVRPTITTISQPQQQIGELSCSLLLNMLNDIPVLEKKNFLETEILVRQSTGACHAP